MTRETIPKGTNEADFIASNIAKCLTNVQQKLSAVVRQVIIDEKGLLESVTRNLSNQVVKEMLQIYN